MEFASNVSGLNIGGPVRAVRVPHPGTTAFASHQCCVTPGAAVKRHAY